MDDKILLRRDGAVATVVINRPEKRNALDSGTWRLLAETVTRLSADETLRCVVFAGAGERAFGSGNDISEFETARSTASQVRAYNEITAGAVRAIENSLHPTVARIRGYCLGGGLEIALACDIRVAARDSKFGLPVRNMGIFLDPALANTLVHAVGRATALEMVLEGRIYEAEEALERGIVTRIVEVAGLDAEIEATVKRIAEGAPLAARFNRRVVRGVAPAAAPSEEALAEAASYGDTEDYRGAYAAFGAGTRPTFRGR